MYSSGIQSELLTPTGALILTEYADGVRSGAGDDESTRVGYGAGDRELQGDAERRSRDGRRGADAKRQAAATSRMQVVVLECEIDDMNPQIFGVLMDRLYAAGALEVFYSAGADEEEPSRHADDDRRARPSSATR